MRVLRTLSRMRALKPQLRQKPAKVGRDYQQRWEDDLGLQEGPGSGPT